MSFTFGSGPSGKSPDCAPSVGARARMAPTGLEVKLVWKIPFESLVIVATVVQFPETDCWTLTVAGFPPGVLPQTSISLPLGNPTRGNANALAYGLSDPSLYSSPD